MHFKKIVETMIHFLEKLVGIYKPTVKEKILISLKYVYTYRKYILLLWMLTVAAAVISSIIYKDTFISGVQNFFLFYPWIGYTLYFLMMMIRGLTFIPLDVIVIAFIPFTNPYILFILTIIGTAITSLIIYYFASYLTLGDHFERKYPKSIGRLHKRFELHELGTVTIWTILPFTPTDIVCYIA